MPLHLLDNLSNLTDPASARSVLGLGVGDSPQFASLTVQGTISSSGPITADSTVTVWRGGGQEIGSTAVGYQSLCSNSTGNANTANGYVALFYNDTGSSNTAIGSQALYQNTDGSNNTAIGYGALINNTLGAGNIATGSLALGINTTGTFNVATGREALYSNSIGNYNVAIGDATLGNITIGDNNTAIGSSAGYTISGGAINDIADNSIYLGANTKALSSGETNQIVIGYDATGIGSNTVTLGNDSIITTALKGNVGIGTTSPNTTLTVVGNISASGMVTSPEFAVTNTTGELFESTNVKGWTAGPNSFSVIAQETQPIGLTFKPDGTRMYIVGPSSDTVHSYTLNPWDISTAVLSSQKSVNAFTAEPYSVIFSTGGANDGKYMFILDRVNRRIGRYTLSGAWNVATAGASVDSGQIIVITSITGLSGATSSQGMTFTPDGSKFFITDVTTDLIHEVSLSIPWDLSTSSIKTLLNNYNVAIASVAIGGLYIAETNPRNLAFNDDGTKLFFTGTATQFTHELKLPTPYSLTGAIYGGRSARAFFDSGSSGVYYSEAVKKCFTIGTTNRTVREYLVNTNIELASDTQILMGGLSGVVMDRLFISSGSSNNSGATGALVVAGSIGAAAIVSSGIIYGNPITTQPANNGYFEWFTQSRIYSNAAGVLRLSNASGAGTDFNRLQFGGITNSFPAIKRNASALDIVFADDTGFTDLRARNITATGILSGLNLVTGGAPLSATSSITLALTDLGRVIRYSGVAAISATVPDQSTVAWPDGSLIYLRRNTGAGTITVQGLSGTIINDNISTSVPAGSMMAIRRVTTNEWDFI